MPEKRTLGLPMRCPKCPPRRYYGVLKGETVPTNLVKIGRIDACPNCRTPLEPTIERSTDEKIRPRASGNRPTLSSLGGGSPAA